jgi:hypothetical protein
LSPAAHFTALSGAHCYVLLHGHVHALQQMKNPETWMAHISYGRPYRSLSDGNNEKQKAARRDSPLLLQASLPQGETAIPAS